MLISLCLSSLAEKGMRLEDFDYYNEDIAQEIYSAMNSTKFLGISVSFLPWGSVH